MGQRGCLEEKNEQKCLQIWVGWERCSLSPSLAGPLGTERKFWGKGKELGASGRRIWRFAGKAWCGPGEGQNTRLGCGSVAASELHFTPPLLQQDAAQRDILGGCTPHPKAGPAVIPAASYSDGRLAWVSYPSCLQQQVGRTEPRGKWTGPSWLSLIQLRKGWNQSGLCQRSNWPWATIVLPWSPSIDMQNLLNIDM